MCVYLLTKCEVSSVILASFIAITFIFNLIIAPKVSNKNQTYNDFILLAQEVS